VTNEGKNQFLQDIRMTEAKKMRKKPSTLRQQTGSMKATPEWSGFFMHLLPFLHEVESPLQLRRSFYSYKKHEGLHRVL